MSTTVIYNDFRPLRAFHSRFRRSELQVWDANLHHGDVRPFACPVEICIAIPVGTSFCTDPDCRDNTDFVIGFEPVQHFFILDNRLRQITTSDMHSNTGDLAGAPFYDSPPVATQMASCDGCDATAISYVVTTVTLHAGIEVESAPSPVSNLVVGGGHIPNVEITWDAVPSGHSIIGTRLYRSESTFEDGRSPPMPLIGAEFILVSEFNGTGPFTFVDDVPTEDTGGPLTTYEPMAFPAPMGIKHLTRTGDGIAVADDYRVYISVPGQPQFTYDGVVNVDHKILAIEAVDNNIFVLTEKNPVEISFFISDGIMTVNRNVVERNMPLKSKASVAVYNNVIYFASEYSLYGWNASRPGSDIGSELKPLMTPDQWKNINPSSVVGTAYEFGYIFSSGNIDHSIMLEFGNDNTDTLNVTSLMPISFVNPDFLATDYDGNIIYGQEGKIYQWDWRRDVYDFEIWDNTSPAIGDCCPWRVVMYFDNERKNRFSKMRVEWDNRTADDLQVRFSHGYFGSEEEIASFNVVNSRGFSIPKFRSAQTFHSEVSGCGIMHEIRMATSNQELSNNSLNQLENAQ